MTAKVKSPKQEAYRRKNNHAYPVCLYCGVQCANRESLEDHMSDCLNREKTITRRELEEMYHREEEKPL